jgi:hypothetical protein
LVKRRDLRTGPKEYSFRTIPFEAGAPNAVIGVLLRRRDGCS